MMRRASSGDGANLSGLLSSACHRRLVGAARQSLGLLAGLQQLLHVVGGEFQEPAELFGHFGGISSCERVVRQAGAARDELGKCRHRVRIQAALRRRRGLRFRCRPLPPRLAGVRTPRGRHGNDFGRRRRWRRRTIGPAVVVGPGGNGRSADRESRTCRRLRRTRDRHRHIGGPVEKIRADRNRIMRALELPRVDRLGRIRPAVPQIVVAGGRVRGRGFVPFGGFLVQCRPMIY